MSISSDRMPPIPLERMTPAQRVAADEIASGRRGAVYGPFVPALRSPGSALLRIPAIQRCTKRDSYGFGVITEQT